MEQQEKESAQKEPPKSKNAEKKARQFDFASMLAETVQTARERSEMSQPAKDEDSERETTERFRNIYIPGGGSSQDDQDEVGPPVPAGLNNQEDDEDDFFPPLPPGFVPDKDVITDKKAPKARAANDRKEDDEDEDEEQETIVTLIPAACEVVIKHSNKPITAVAFDHQGTKFAVGGYNYAVQLFEFQKMDLSMKPSKEVFPCESHIINSLAFSANGENLLIASGNAQLKLLDRNANEWCETVKGDQYLVDLANTKGHTASVNGCQFHPFNKKEFLTCGDDGTLRIWSVDDYKEVTKCINSQQKVIKVKNAGGKRAIPTSCCYSVDGKLIAAGCDDGSIHVWKYGSVFVNPTYLNRNAHKGPITCLTFSPDNGKILSRSLDDTMKLFDLKKFKEPLKTASDLPNMYPQTVCGYSPHGEFIFTGISEKSKAGETGGLLFFGTENLDLLYRINYDSMGCISIAWHNKINQMLVGLSDGTCRLYYDLSNSVRGALQCVARPVRRSRDTEVIKDELILAPLTLEMFQAKGEDDEEKEVTEWRLRRYLRQLSNKSRPNFRKPAEMPMDGPSSGGRIAKSGGTLHAYIAKELGVQKNKTLQQEDEDVRAAILKHADEAEKDPLYITKAYKRTQPKPIFQDKTTEDEPDDSLEPVYKVHRLG